MKSMTGFGRAEIKTRWGKVVAEARSENHRFLDISFQVSPQTLSLIEPNLTEIVREKLSRGKVKVTVKAEGLGNKTLPLNLGRAKEYWHSIKRLKKELGIEEEIRLEHLLMIRDVFSGDEEGELDEKNRDEVKMAVKKAVYKLEKSRETEGKKLEKDFRERAVKIRGLIKKIEAKRGSFLKEASEKLRERIKDVFEDLKIDEERLYQEVVLLTEKSDITEEVVRLKSHMERFKEIVKKDGAIGRELDFLLQEINREANTVSAKSKDAEISHLVVELKAELEKIREQAQNIE